MLYVGLCIKFLSSILFSMRDLKITLSDDGTMASYEFTGGSGMPVKSHFCVNCGTRVFGEAEAFPELVFIMIGAFENSRLFKPRFEIFNNYRLDWLTHNGSIEESFDEHAVEERIGAMLESLNDR